jgi:hypothetical protein
MVIPIGDKNAIFHIPVELRNVATLLPKHLKRKCMTILSHEINIEKKNVNFNPKNMGFSFVRKMSQVEQKFTMYIYYHLSPKVGGLK